MLGQSTETVGGTFEELNIDMIPFKDNEQREQFAQGLIKDKLVKKTAEGAYYQPLPRLTPDAMYAAFRHDYAAIKGPRPTLPKPVEHIPVDDDTDPQLTKLPLIRSDGYYKDRAPFQSPVKRKRSDSDNTNDKPKKPQTTFDIE